MPVKRPTPARLRDVAADLGITLTDADLDFFLGLATGAEVTDGTDRDRGDRP